MNKKLTTVFWIIEGVTAVGSLGVAIYEAVKGKKMTDQDKSDIAKLIVDEQETRKKERSKKSTKVVDVVAQ